MPKNSILKNFLKYSSSEFTPIEDKHIDEYDKYRSEYHDERAGNFYDIGELAERVQELENENKELRSQIYDLEKSLEDLNHVIMEQFKGVYDWITVR